MAFSGLLKKRLLHYSMIAVLLWAGTGTQLSEADLLETSVQQRKDILTQRGLSKAQIPFDFLSPIYHIPARIHTTESRQSEAELLVTLNEMNTIWWTQAGICFIFEVVRHNDILEEGFNLWFGGNLDGWNGYFSDIEDIRVLDIPDLRSAPFGSEHNAARTAAHEFGHALNLPHRQNSDNNLMRSKTKGWLLNREEVETARSAAAFYSRPGQQLDTCTTPIFKYNQH